MIGGLSSILQTSVIITILQSETDDAFRGRVVSLIAMAIFGMIPLGSLLVGYLAPIIGTQFTVFIEGIISILIGILFYTKLIHTTTTLKQIDHEK